MITEQDARRADQIPGSFVHLADGGEWTIPAPGQLETYQDDSWFQTSYARAVLDLFEAQDEEERQAAELALAICLLSRNYHLDPSGYRKILCVREPRAREELRHHIHDAVAVHADTFGRREHDRIGHDHQADSPHWYGRLPFGSQGESLMNPHA